MRNNIEIMIKKIQKALITESLLHLMLNYTETKNYHSDRF